MKFKLLFIVLMFLTLCVGCASAETHIPAGAVNSYSLGVANEKYILDGDVTADTTAFVVNADNIMFDGNGHTIVCGTTGAGIGISCSNHNNITLENIVVNVTNNSASGAHGIYGNKMNNSLIVNCTSTSIGCSGVNLVNCNNTTVDKCTATSTTSKAMVLSSVIACYVNNSTALSNSNVGYHLLECTNTTSNNATGISISNVGLELQKGMNCTLYKCTGLSNTSFGLYLYQDYAPNTCYSCVGNSTSTSGFIIRDSTACTLNGCKGNSFGNGSGINVYTNTTNSVIETCSGYTNSSDDDDGGIAVINSVNISMFNSVGFSPNTNGYYVYLTNNSNTLNMSASSVKGYGLYSYTGTSNNYENSTFNSTKVDGAYFYSNSTNNTIKNCTMVSNTLKGVRLRQSAGNIFSLGCVAISPVSATGHTTNEILITGDSISEGFPDIENGGWGTILKDNLTAVMGANYYIVNQANSGEQSDAGRKNLEAYLDIFDPTYVTIMYGCNDINHGREQADIITDILWMASTAQARGITPIIMLTPAENLTGNAGIIALDQNLSTQAKAMNFTVINIYDLLDTTPNNGVYDSFDQTYYVDTAHPNTLGRSIIAEHVTRNIHAMHHLYSGVNLTSTVDSQGSILYSRDVQVTDKLAEMYITPDTGNVLINVDIWSTTGEYKKLWTESSETHATITRHIIGGFPASAQIQVKRDGVNYALINSNDTGYIDWTYDGGYSEHTFEATVVSASIVTDYSFAPNWLSTIGLVGVCILLTLVAQIVLMLRGKGSIKDIEGDVSGIVIVLVIILVGTILFSQL